MIVETIAPPLVMGVRIVVGACAAADGRCIARATWPTDPAWWRIPAAVDAPLDERGEVPARDLERDVPGSTRWVERWERWLLLMGIGPIVVAGIIVVVIGALTR